MAKAKVTEKNIKLILQGSMGKAILALAVPVVINSFLQTMYNLTDTYWLGQLGTNELAAINLVSPLQQIVVNFGSGLTVAGAVLIAQLIGASKKEEAASMASQIFVCAMIFSIICAGVIAIFTPTVVNWLGADEPTAKVANVYLRIVILDMPFLYMVNIFAAIRQAQGDTVSPMFLNLTGILLNVILDPLLMIVIHWGAAGAALATVIAKAVPAMISLVILKRDTTGVRIRLKGFRFEKSKMKSILTVGLPTAIGGSTMQLGFLLMSRNVYVTWKSINVVLDPLLMIVIHWGAAGAALATVIAKAVPAMISLVILKRDTTGVRIRLKGFRFEKSKMKSILTVGLPTAIGGSTMQLGFLLMSRNVYVYGTGAMAAYGIGNKVNGLITLPSNGIGSAVATIVGQNIGANQIDRAEKGYKIARRVSVIFLFVGGLILSRPFLSEAIVGLFSTDEEVIAMADSRVVFNR